MGYLKQFSFESEIKLLGSGPKVRNGRVTVNSIFIALVNKNDTLLQGSRSAKQTDQQRLSLFTKKQKTSHYKITFV